MIEKMINGLEVDFIVNAESAYQLYIDLKKLRKSLNKKMNSEELINVIMKLGDLFKLYHWMVEKKHEYLSLINKTKFTQTKINAFLTFIDKFATSILEKIRQVDFSQTHPE